MPETLEILEAVTATEEVAAAGETADPDLLTTLSQQLDTVISWQTVQASNQWVIMGLILGIVVALVIGRMWR